MHGRHGLGVDMMLTMRVRVVGLSQFEIVGLGWSRSIMRSFIDSAFYIQSQPSLALPTGAFH